MKKILFTVAALFVSSLAVAQVAAPAAGPAASTENVAPAAGPAANTNNDVNALKEKFHHHKGKHGKGRHHHDKGVSAGAEHAVHGKGVYKHDNVHHCIKYCESHHAHLKTADANLHGEVVKDCKDECKHHHKSHQVTNPVGAGKGAGARPVKPARQAR